MKTLSLFLFISASIFCCSCDKDTDTSPNPPEPTVTELLTAHSWKYKAHVIDANSNGILDETIDTVKTCLQDDLWFIKPDHSMQLLRGAEACNEPGEPTLDTDNAGTWQLAFNDTQFTYSEINNGETLTGDIAELTTERFVFKVKVVSGAPLLPAEFDVYIK